MKEEEAKQQLKRMLQSFTAGSILHLLGDLFGESAKKVGRQNQQASKRHKMVEATLFVVGLGIDAVSPK